MKLSTTLRLLIAVLVLAGVVWIVDNRIDPDRLPPQGSRVITMPLDDADYVVIDRDGHRMECRRVDGRWELRDPVRAAADESAMNRLLSVLEGLTRDEVITAEECSRRELSPAAYGLSHPRIRLRFGNRNAHGSLLVGNDAPLGNHVYVKLAWSGDIICTSRELLHAVPANVAGLRDRSIFRWDAEHVLRLEIGRPGAAFTRMVFDKGRWSIREPFVAHADPQKVRALLNALYSARIATFVWDPPVEDVEAEAPAGGVEQPARIEPYGLGDGEAVARVSLWLKGGDEAGTELILGKEAPDGDGTLYAKIRGAASVFSVDRSLLDALSVSAGDLRSSELFARDLSRIRYACFQEGDARVVFTRSDTSGWSIREPLQRLADDQSLDALLENLQRLTVAMFVIDEPADLEAFGLVQPGWMIHLLDAPPAAATETSAESSEPDPFPRLLLGRIDEAAGTVYAKFENNASVFTLDVESLKALGVFPLDPMAFFDRTMLAVSAESARSITLSRQGREQRVVRDDENAWFVAEPTNAVPVPEAIESVLFLASNLRARRIVSHNPENLAVYGLDQPEIQLTLGLSGKEGIQKTLMLGFRARTEGLYAMVRGQDVVFVLPSQTVHMLVGDLAAPLAAVGE